MEALRQPLEDGEITISRGRRNGCSIFVDDFSVKASPLSCVKLSAKEMAREELVKQWDIPIKELEALSTGAVKDYKPWFVPAEKNIDILYLACENRVGRLHSSKRGLAELAMRLPMNIKTIPVIRQVVSSTGSYGVWVMTFRKNLSDYTAECLKEIKKAPKVVILTSFQEKLHDKDTLDVLVKWQKAGTNFLFYGCTPPKALSGKWMASPVKYVVPMMRNLPPEKMIRWYKKGSSIIAVSYHLIALKNVIYYFLVFIIYLSPSSSSIHYLFIIYLLYLSLYIYFLYLSTYSSIISSDMTQRMYLKSLLIYKIFLKTASLRQN